jgi:hypothetical protein
LDDFVSASYIIKFDVEEESSPPYSKDAMMDSKEEIMNMEDSTPTATTQFAMGSNEPPMELDSTQYVRKIVW